MQESLPAIRQLKSKIGELSKIVMIVMIIIIIIIMMTMIIIIIKLMEVIEGCGQRASLPTVCKEATNLEDHPHRNRCRDYHDHDHTLHDDHHHRPDHDGLPPHQIAGRMVTVAGSRLCNILKAKPFQLHRQTLLA